MTDNNDRQMGLQPLDAVLEENKLTNSDLVEASTEQLTHKQVQKSRKGRRVTGNIQKKILNALNSIEEGKESGKKYAVNDLFTYEG
jgi:hypothetical protein